VSAAVATFEKIDLMKPVVFVGRPLGAMLVFLFSSLAIRAVGKARFLRHPRRAGAVQGEAGILQGTDKPDYGRCVDIVTRGRSKRWCSPGLLAVGLPILVGVAFKAFRTAEDPFIAAEAVGALLMVGTIAGS